MFILGLGNHLEALKSGLGGVIFFTKDIQSSQQLIESIAEINANASIAPFISIDQEGGRVERTENIRPRRLSAANIFKQGSDALKRQSEEISKELFEWGFNLNFAPCIDVNTNPNNPIIGERAFANNVEDVITGFKIFTTESRKKSVIPCVKHFPGHGDADKDSHLILPQIDLPLEQMEKIHIAPFKEAIKQKIEMIMIAHLHCTCFNQNPIPTSLSSNAINYLRQNLNYNGVLISDDMVMQGVQSFGSLEACIEGIKSGLDMFIFRNSDSSTINMIEELSRIVEKDEKLQKRVLESNNRILDLKRKYNII